MPNKSDRRGCKTSLLVFNISKQNNMINLKIRRENAGNPILAETIIYNLVE